MFRVDGVAEVAERSVTWKLNWVTRRLFDLFSSPKSVRAGLRFPH